MKLGETLNRYNFEDRNFRLTNRRSLEARNLALWNAFWFTSISFSIPEISLCKDKDNFLIIPFLVRYSDFSFPFSLPPRLKFQTTDRRDSSWGEKNIGHRVADPFIIFIPKYFKSLYLGNRSRYRDDKQKTDFNGIVSPPRFLSGFWLYKTSPRVFSPREKSSVLNFKTLYKTILLIFCKFIYSGA